MAWIEPKTNWESTDYFNIEDYKRIVGNLTYLKSFSEKLFRSYDLLDVEQEKTYSSMIYAREINAIENNLETVNINTYNFDIGDTKEFYPNKNTPLWSEFNRIESAMLLLHKTMLSHENSLPRLAFTLGCRKGFGGDKAICLKSKEGTELRIDDALPNKDVYEMHIDGYTVKDENGLHSHGEKSDGTYGVDVENVGKNILDINNTLDSNFENNNGLISNKLIDTRTYLECHIQFFKNNTFIGGINCFSANKAGRYAKNFTLDDDFDIRIKHNGSKIDLTIVNYTYFHLPKGTYTLSMDVLGCDPTVVGGLVIKDIIISKGTEETQYEPYHEPQTVSIPLSAPLRSVNDIKDEIVFKDGKWWEHRRLGSVDLGTLSWYSYETKETGKYRFGSNGIASSIKTPSSITVKGNICCSKYDTIIQDDPWRLVVGISLHQNGIVFIYDDAYAESDADTFKSSLSGQELIYELAEDTWTEIADVQAIIMKEDTNIITNSDDAYMKMKYEV